MMGLERAVVLLMCACVIMAATTTAEDNTTETTTPTAINFDDFIADLTDNIDNRTARIPEQAIDYYLQTRLYESINQHNYDSAVQQCKNLVKQNKSKIIESTVNRLIYEERSETTSFAYKVWEGKGRAVVENLFPNEFDMVFNDSLVYFTHYYFNEPIELGSEIDSAQDKNVYGNSRNPNGTNYAWKLEPVFKEDDIYFKIRHNADGRYLKLASDVDENVRYVAYGSPDSATNRHLWLLQPVRNEDYTGSTLLFFIINYEYFLGLTLSYEPQDGDRQAFGIGKDYDRYPDLYGWKVRVVKGEVDLE